MTKKISAPLQTVETGVSLEPKEATSNPGRGIFVGIAGGGHVYV